MNDVLPKDLKLSSEVSECKPLVRGAGAVQRSPGGGGGRGLHSFTLELNLSTSRTHSWVQLGDTMDRTAQLELKRVRV